MLLFTLVAMSLDWMTSPIAPRSQHPDTIAGLEVTVRPDYQDKPLSEIVAEIEKTSGFMFVSRLKPTGTVTLKLDRDVTVIELIQLLNEKLESRKLGFSVRHFSFCLFDWTDEETQKSTLPGERVIRSNEVPRCHDKEIAVLSLEWTGGPSLSEATATAKKLMSDRGEIVESIGPNSTHPILQFKEVETPPSRSRDYSDDMLRRSPTRRFRATDQDERKRLLIRDTGENLRRILAAILSRDLRKN